MREITRPGELSRAELEEHVRTHLWPAFKELEKLGIVVAVVAAPAKDPVDGKALVCGSAVNYIEMFAMFAHAVKKLAAGQAFDLPRGTT